MTVQIGGTDSRSEPVPVALFGLGSWGRRLLSCCEANRELSVRWVYDPVLPPESARYSTCEKSDVALRDPTVEAVLIASPEETHAELALRALDLGKHVFVEKPMCVNSAQRNLLANHPRASTHLMVGHILHFDWAFAALGRLGRTSNILGVSSVRHSLPGSRPLRCPWWSLAPHDISVLVRLWGLPLAVRVTSPAAGEAEAVLQFAAGQIAQLSLSTRAASRRRCFTASGNRFEFRICESEEGGCVLVAGDRAQRLRLPSTTPMVRELRHFAHVVRRRAKPLTGLHDGLAVVDVLLAGQSSLDSGRWTTLNPRASAMSDAFLEQDQL